MARKRTSTEEKLRGLLRWMEPEEFLGLCLRNADLRELIDQDGDAGQIEDLLNEIFDEQYLVQILERFDEAKQRIAKFLRLYGDDLIEDRGDVPRKLKWRPGDLKRKYRWLCKDCGERCGIHYFPIDYCRTCGEQNIVRQVTKSVMGYTYARKRVIN